MMCGSKAERAKRRAETKERKVESRTEQSRVLVQNSSASSTPKIEALTTDRVDRQNRAEKRKSKTEQNRAEESREQQNRAERAETEG
jgi:hypothetical protein